MRERLIQLWGYARTPSGLKMLRYTAVSAISASTSLVLVVVTYGFLRLGSEVFCTLLSNVLAGIPSYYLNRAWVWKKNGRSHWWRELLPFWVMSITGIGFALYTASRARIFAEQHHLHHLGRTILVVGANVAAFAILWVLKFVILNRLFAEIADAEVGIESDDQRA